ncbi:DUF2807 domain-containing protein [Maribacter sp.]|uniref:GIN domain-containing protein n=1 Tax=Maribacter sp. TaxID=1897614 RepID=UPI0025C703DF|nr:DUF2807 domain-containing protein [Maribacter sp.]
MKTKIGAVLFWCLSLFVFQNSSAQGKIIAVKAFDKVIVSPHIEVALVEGDEEQVFIEKAKLPEHKINVEVEGKTLRVYLEGAKTITKSEDRYENGRKVSRSLYEGTMVSVRISYKKLRALSIRGEEVVNVMSAISQKDLKLTIYGESKVYFNSLTVDQLTASIYGESYLEIKGGLVQKQVYRAYGESEVNTVSLNNVYTKITAYGESNFRVNVSGRLKVTCYGETTINYTGDAAVEKGIVIGEAEIRKVG